MPLSREAALALADVDHDAVIELCTEAARIRDRVTGSVVTYSPKAFLPLTNLCRNRCDYCSFRRSSGDAGEWTMTHDEVHGWLDRARGAGCGEALFCLGDRPETAFVEYKRLLARWGHDDTVDYLEWAGRAALERQVLPHTNAGVLSREAMARLRPVNVSLGLMLENVSPRLCEPGMPHHRAPDKRPRVRLAMLRAAGELRIPFTTGILIGIGETRTERVESLLAIRDLHREHGHVQEVIVQNFTPRPEIALSDRAEAGDTEMLHAVALARLILDEDVSLQAPPNLNPTRTAALLGAGINDFGGISPVTPDYVNHRHPWPHVGALEATCRELGFTLRPRAPIYPRYVREPGWLDDGLREITQQTMARFERAPSAAELA